MKAKTKRILTAVVCTVVAVVLLGLLGFVSNGFSTNTDEWGVSQVNTDNLLKVDNYDIEDINTGDGYEIDVTKDGEIKLTGKNESESSKSHKVQDIELEKGTYTFSSGAKNTSMMGYHMYIQLEENGTKYYADFGANSTFTLETDVTVTVYIGIAAETELNVKFSPVIVKGEEAGSFFVVGNNK